MYETWKECTGSCFEMLTCSVPRLTTTVYTSEILCNNIYSTSDSDKTNSEQQQSIKHEDSACFSWSSSRLQLAVSNLELWGL